MKMKRIISLILMLTIVLSGCGGGSSTPSAKTTGEEFIDNLTFVQNLYVGSYDIDVIEFGGRSKVSALMTTILDGDYKGEVTLVDDNTKLFKNGKYYEANEAGDYYYLGDIKKGLPDGYGILLKRDSAWGDSLAKAILENDIESLKLLSSEDVKFGVSGIEYIGSFKEGRFDGYGMEFSPIEGYRIKSILGVNAEEYFYDVMDGNTGFYGSFISTDDADFNSVAAAEEFYDFGRSFLTYEGEFEEGIVSGKGNEYWFPDEASALQEEMLSGVKVINTIILYVGEFDKEKYDGKGSYYLNGLLIYEGEYKKGKMHGKGKAYAADGRVAFEGEFIKDERGDGKTYDLGEVEIPDNYYGWSLAQFYNGPYKMDMYDSQETDKNEFANEQNE